MTTPKFKENGHERADRLRLGKPHIFFCSVAGEWIRANAPECYDLPGAECAFEFCVAQDNRSDTEGQNMNQSERSELAAQYERGELDDEQYEQELARLLEDEDE